MSSVQKNQTSITEQFNSVLEFNDWARKQPDVWVDLVEKKEKIASGFFGKDLKNLSFEEAQKVILNEIVLFDNLDLIENLGDDLNYHLTLGKVNDIPKKKLKYNDLGIGVFSFDAAAQGMYRLKELYSETRQQVIDAKLAKGLTLAEDGTPLIERWEEKNNGKPKIRTNNKKVWAFFPKVKRQREAAEIYISCGNYDEVSAEDFVYSGVVAIVIAKKLIASQIPVKINLVMGWEDWNLNYACAVVPIKEFNDPLDINTISIISSDVRYWRQVGYQACNSMLRAKLWGPSQGGLIGEDLKRRFEKINYRTDVKNRFYFGRVRNIDDAFDHIKIALEKISKSLIT